jgi:hypothetical protein
MACPWRSELHQNHQGKAECSTHMRCVCVVHSASGMVYVVCVPWRGCVWCMWCVKYGVCVYTVWVVWCVVFVWYVVCMWCGVCVHCVCVGGYMWCGVAWCGMI